LAKQGLREHKARKGLRVRKEQLAHKVLRAHRVLKETSDLRVILVLKVT
jgi:Mn-dependent DtxR family transcriptional regulator